jgi:hypothetical protein
MSGDTLARALNTKTMRDLSPSRWDQVREAVRSSWSLEDMRPEIRALFEDAAEEIERRSKLQFETKGEADGETA